MRLAPLEAHGDLSEGSSLVLPNFGVVNTRATLAGRMPSSQLIVFGADQTPITPHAVGLLDAQFTDLQASVHVYRRHPIHRNKMVRSAAGGLYGLIKSIPLRQNLG